MIPDELTLREAAALIPIHSEHIIDGGALRRKIKQEKIAGFKDGHRHWKIAKKEVDRFSAAFKGLPLRHQLKII